MKAIVFTAIFTAASLYSMAQVDKKAYYDSQKRAQYRERMLLKAKMQQAQQKINSGATSTSQDGGQTNTFYKKAVIAPASDSSRIRPRKQLQNK